MRIFPVIVTVLALALPLSVPVVHFTTQETVKVEVMDKERVIDGNGSKYLIFTKNEVFENTDSFLSLKFDSSDIYGKIKDGDTCTFDVTGLRIPFLSMYRNIVTTECKSPEDVKNS